MTPNDPGTPEAEGRHHRYRGNEIPWYVHVLWVAYWTLAIYYVLRFLFPVIQGELSNPP